MCESITHECLMACSHVLIGSCWYVVTVYKKYKYNDAKWRRLATSSYLILSDIHGCGICRRLLYDIHMRTLKCTATNPGQSRQWSVQVEQLSGREWAGNGGGGGTVAAEHLTHVVRVVRFGTRDYPRAKLESERNIPASSRL